MTANMQIADYIGADFKKIKDADTLKNVTESIKQEFTREYKNEECVDSTGDNYAGEYNKILSLTFMSIKMYASSSFKKSEFLETSEIDRIKSALANYTNNNQKVEEFKTKIINDLTDFQKQINANHIQRITDLTKQKLLYEKELTVLINGGCKPKKSNFIQIVWSVKVEQQEHENRITVLQAKIKQLGQKLTDMEQKRPFADAKDILLYRLAIKEKYNR